MIASEDILSLPIWERGSYGHQDGKATEEPDICDMPAHHRDQSSTPGECQCGRGLQGLVSTMGKLLLNFQRVIVAMELISLELEGNGSIVLIVHGLSSWPLLPDPQ